MVVLRYNFKKLYCYIWNQYPRICLIEKVCEETKMPKSGTKNALLGYFWQKMRYLGIFVQDFWKSYSHIWNQHPPICLIAKVWKKEMPNFGTKNTSFGCFGARILKKLFSYLKAGPTKCLFAKFHEKWKYLKLGQKWNDLCIFGLGLWKNIVIFEISTLEFV